MIQAFLKAKHWQLFILTVGIPLIFQFYFMGNMMEEMVVNIDNQTEPDPTKIFKMMRFLPLLMILNVGLLFGWYWSIVMGLQNKIPENVKMKIPTFKLFFIIPLFYIIIISIVMGALFNGTIKFDENPNGGTIGAIIGVALLFHFLSMFGILYSMYFIAKTIKTIELQKEVRFNEFVGEFFLLWFYPVGIWILQPKINNLAEGKTKLDIETLD